jgi:hypothetical protein
VSKHCNKSVAIVLIVNTGNHFDSASCSAVTIRYVYMQPIYSYWSDVHLHIVAAATKVLLTGTFTIITS